jgi:hypothetical protein
MFIYIMEGNLIQSKHTDLNDNFIQKCPTSWHIKLPTTHHDSAFYCFCAVSR